MQLSQGRKWRQQYKMDEYVGGQELLQVRSHKMPLLMSLADYLGADSSSFRISRQLIVAVLDLNNRQLIVALCDVRSVIVAYSFLVVIVTRKERKLCGTNFQIASKRFGCGWQAKRPPRSIASCTV